MELHKETSRGEGKTVVLTAIKPGKGLRFAIERHKRETWRGGMTKYWCISYCEGSRRPGICH